MADSVSCVVIACEGKVTGSRTQSAARRFRLCQGYGGTGRSFRALPWASARIGGMEKGADEVFDKEATGFLADLQSTEVGEMEGGADEFVSDEEASGSLADFSPLELVE